MTSTNGAHRRARSTIIAMVATLATAVITVSGTLPAGAAPVNYSPTPVAGWSTNGPVYATAIVGNTVYAGGNFTQVRGPGGTPVANRRNLAAFDRTTGAVRTGFVADTDAPVRALTANGTHLYVGGTFSTIGGTARGRLGAVDPTTGAVIPAFVANADSNIYALARRGARLFVGGSFRTIGGTARGRLAAVDTTSGAPDASFRPDADNTVTAVTASPDASVVYAGGQFTTIGGTLQSYLAAVSGVTGANTGLGFGNAPKGQVLALDVSPFGGQLFVGSVANRAASYNTASGARQWYQQTDGDVQAIRYANGNVFFGFHDGFALDTSKHLLAADAASGVLEPWQPSINSFWGVWAIAAKNQELAIGGEFTTFSGVSTQGVAVLPAVTPPPATTLGFDADTSVATDSPTRNFGIDPTLKLHSPTSEYRTLVRFTVSGLTAKPQSVKLRLFVADGSTTGGSWYLASNAWDEAGVVWNTAPAVSGTPVATLGAVALGSWVDVDVTNAVTGNGTYSFIATSTATDTAQFSSREGTNPPQVIVVK